jgi:hypothetical protein
MWLVGACLCAASVVNPAAVQRVVPRAIQRGSPRGFYRQSFESGDVDWAGEWDTDDGRDTYRSFYRVDRLAPGLLFRDRQSYYCDVPHDYLTEQALHIIKPYAEHGFWDPAAGSWIGRIFWTAAGGWSGVTPHEWASSTELEEGALMAAMISGNCAMDQRIAQELRYIHAFVASDGAVSSLMLPQDGFEYGTILSSLALGAIYFNALDRTVAQTAYGDMRRVFRYVATNYAVPLHPVEMMCFVVRGYVNAYYAFDAYGDAQLRDIARERVESLASLLPRYQKENGAFDLLDDTYRVQKQLKADIALLLAYGVTGAEDYAEAATRNIDWVIANRFDRGERCTGGITWCTVDSCAFFEVHTMWFLIAAAYAERFTEVSYEPYREEAVAFLTDDNFAGVDMFADNERRYGAFFSYRAISRDGTIQQDPFHQWKGAYEIGASLWAMALNYDCRTEGYNWLVTQAPEDSSDSWGKAIFTARDFGSGGMLFRWDARFRDTRFPGARTGLFDDRRGDWRVLLDTDAGLSYRTRTGQTHTLVGRECLASGKRYTVTIDRFGRSRMKIGLLEDGAPIYEGSVDDALPFEDCYFGAFQDNGGALSARNIFIDNIEFAPTDLVPDVCKLYRSYPNPFNQGTTIEYDLAATSAVEIRIYDASGRCVAHLPQGTLGPGHYRARWDGKRPEGARFASGVYVCTLRAGTFTRSQKLVLLR